MKAAIVHFLKIIDYFCDVIVFEVNIYTENDKLPVLMHGNFFHSRELFEIAANSPGCSPYMAVATDGEQRVVAQLLVIVQRRSNLFPPYLYTHAHAFGEGEYLSGVQVEPIFSQMLEAVTRRLNRSLCLYIEFSGLRKKMLGYKSFRKLGYFPIPWQEVYNSLHSMAPEQRLTEKTKRRLTGIVGKGLDTHEADDGELRQFHKFLKRHYRFKLRRYIPPFEFFEGLQKSKNALVMVTTFKNHVIGGSACVYTEDNAYLWFMASRRKSYALLRPGYATVWHAIKYAHECHCRHFCFMDAGLPWHKDRQRSFVLGFGGKPVAKYRWFKFHSRLVNRILGWFYSD